MHGTVPAVRAGLTIPPRGAHGRAACDRAVTSSPGALDEMGQPAIVEGGLVWNLSFRRTQGAARSYASAATPMQGLSCRPWAMRRSNGPLRATPGDHDAGLRFPLVAAGPGDVDEVCLATGHGASTGTVGLAIARTPVTEEHTATRATIG
jgi:hypothetical protein